jgi:hypothetical protein
MEVKGSLLYRHGHWCDETAEASSNYRELKSLVDGLEEMVRSGRVRDAEVFLFTDNSTALCSSSGSACERWRWMEV